MPPGVAPPAGELLRVSHQGRPVDLAATIRHDGPDLLVCLHGWGCSRESFRSAFSTPMPAGWSVCAVDLPGHGDSGSLPTDDDLIQAYADVTVSLVRRLAPHRVVLLGHSMGGAVGLVAGQALPELIGCVSVEGNLVAQDCGLVSRGVATLPREEFVARESHRLRAELTGSDRSDLRSWGGWFGRADPAVLHRAARSLVEWSDSGKLFDLFTTLDHAGYLYGRESDLDYLLPLLADVVPSYPVPSARHFPMLDNPVAFWPTVTGLVSAWARPLVPA